MSIRVFKTFEGIVAREFHVGGEHAYRRRHDGGWDHCLDHKGPWIVTRCEDVPVRFRDAVETERNDSPPQYGVSPAVKAIRKFRAELNSASCHDHDPA